MTRINTDEIKIRFGAEIFNENVVFTKKISVKIREIRGFKISYLQFEYFCLEARMTRINTDEIKIRFGAEIFNENVVLTKKVSVKIREIRGFKIGYLQFE
ncbi:MAG: hypothetical protein Q4G69_05665 [Planctomycetia bacterium]|nr:hypothetical protein [Planctomycetia bacterium]